MLFQSCFLNTAEFWVGCCRALYQLWHQLLISFLFASTQSHSHICLSSFPAAFSWNSWLPSLSSFSFLLQPKPGCRESGLPDCRGLYGHGAHHGKELPSLLPAVCSDPAAGPGKCCSLAPFVRNSLSLPLQNALGKRCNEQ